MTNKFQYITDNQLIVVTGARGVGKTTFAATFTPATKENMARVFWHDSEQSANRVKKDFEDAGMPFGYYLNLGSRFSDMKSSDDLITMINKGQLPWVDRKERGALENYYKFILNDIDKNLTPGKFDIYVHDTLEKLEAGMAAWVENNKRDAGVTSTAFGKLWSEGVYPLYEAFTEALFARGVKTIILTSHLKNPWEGNRPVPGKVAPAGKKLLYRLSSLMIWLVNTQSRVPAGLILKERMGKIEAVDGVWQPKRMLPERIPQCTWTKIDEYLTNGCDFDNPKPGEVMSPQEKEMISELLTDEQMRLMILAEEKEIEEMKQQPSSLFSVRDTVVPEEVSSEVQQTENKQSQYTEAQKTAVDLYVKQKMSNVEVAKQLSIPLPMVLSIRSELGI